ncbi:hypothetical protein VVAX_04616 [Variovorax paradoxus]|uniref:Uncharacterized protein n=1 Tax=Variovorax paradoxus TaxID=34073 RepID=A0A679JDB4_VARPD|nr:hypothetical protein VVAX_04616 [Variovorax paradoxus]
MIVKHFFTSFAFAEWPLPNFPSKNPRRLPFPG